MSCNLPVDKYVNSKLPMMSQATKWSYVAQDFQNDTSIFFE